MAGVLLAVGSCVSGADAQCGGGVHPRSRGLFGLLLADCDGARRLSRLGAATGGRCGRLAVVPDHFEAIGKGVVDLRDVAFFALTMVMFSGRQRRSARSS